jgi:hypothetical protein
MIKVLQRDAPNASIGATLTETSLASYALPGKLMGPDSQLRIQMVWAVNNNGNNKILRCYLGASIAMNLFVTTVQSVCSEFIIANVNDRAVQKISGAQGSQNASNGITTLTIDTAQATTISFKGTKAVTGDTITLVSYSIYLIDTEDEDLPFGTGKIGATLDSQPTYNLYTFVDGKSKRKDWK